MRRTTLRGVALALVAVGGLTAGAADTAAQSGLLPDGTASASTSGAETWPTTFEGVTTELARIENEERSAERARRSVAERVSALRLRRLLNGRHYARLARAGLLPLGGGLGELSRHAAQLQRLRRALTRDLALEQDLDRERTRLAQKVALLKERKVPLEAQRRTLEDVQAAALAAQDRALAFERAFMGSNALPHTAVYGAGIGPNDATELARGFAVTKGQLPVPVPGRTEITRVLRRGAGGAGLEVRVIRGSAVRAVYPGRVAFADTYAEYGKTVIVDHGGGYYTVSADLGMIAVGVGDEVSAGSRLGIVSDKGDVGLLYFEIRKDGELVEPAPWFGL